jgi:hypothetical protein
VRADESEEATREGSPSGSASTGALMLASVAEPSSGAGSGSLPARMQEQPRGSLAESTDRQVADAVRAVDATAEGSEPTMRMLERLQARMLAHRRLQCNTGMVTRTDGIGLYYAV